MGGADENCVVVGVGSRGLRNKSFGLGKSLERKEGGKEERAQSTNINFKQKSNGPLAGNDGLNNHKQGPWAGLMGRI